MSDLLLAAAPAAAAPPAWSDWYVLQSVVGREEHIADALRRRFIPEPDVALPRRKLKLRRQGELFDAEKPLFPGYLFFRAGAGEQEERFRTIRHARRELPGLVRVLEFGRGPQPIYRAEESVIWSLMDDTQLIDYTKVAYEGKQVRVISGPLLDQFGRVRSVDRRKGRAKVELFLLGEMRLVDLGLEALEVTN